MRFEIRDPEGPDARIAREKGTKHELVTVTYESSDGRTRHSNVTPMTDLELLELERAVYERIETTLRGI